MASVRVLRFIVSVKYLMKFFRKVLANHKRRLMLFLHRQIGLEVSSIIGIFVYDLSVPHFDLFSLFTSSISPCRFRQSRAAFKKSLVILTIMCDILKYSSPRSTCMTGKSLNRNRNRKRKSDMSFRFPDQLPGQLYDAVIQCRWQFGSKVTLCPFNFAKVSLTPPTVAVLTLSITGFAIVTSILLGLQTAE